MKVGVVAGLLACACGDVTSNEPDAPNGDAPAACDVTKPFGAPVPIGGVNTTGHDYWGVMSDDRLTLYFSSAEVGSLQADLFYATRRSASDDFSGITPLRGVNTDGESEQRGTLTADGRTLVYQFQDISTRHWDLFIKTRTSAAVDFPGTPPERLAISLPNTHDWDAFISGDGLTLYFASTRPGVGDSNIFWAERSSTSDAFGGAMLVDDLSSPELKPETAPVPSPDGLEIFFERQDSDNGPDSRMFHATRPSRDVDFGALREIVELNASRKNTPNWISPDRCQLVFASDRAGGAGELDLWTATRPR